MKSNIWTCCALSREACLPTWLYLLAYCTRYYWLHGNCVWLALTSKAPFSEGVLGLSRRPDLDYHSKSMADFCPPSVLMKKPSLISTVITDRLADIWPRQGGGSDGSALMSWVMSSFPPSWSLHLKHDMTLWKPYSANLTHMTRLQFKQDGTWSVTLPEEKWKSSGMAHWGWVNCSFWSGHVWNYCRWCSTFLRN